MKLMHLETVTQNVVGILIGFLILHLWGLPLMESLQLQLVFVVISYIRSYYIRKFFSKYY